jgi:hypothetical protein
LIAESIPVVGRCSSRQCHCRKSVDAYAQLYFKAFLHIKTGHSSLGIVNICGTRACCIKKALDPEDIV